MEKEIVTILEKSHRGSHMRLPASNTPALVLASSEFFPKKPLNRSRNPNTSWSNSTVPPKKKGGYGTH